MNAMPASTDLGLPNDLGRILLSSLSWNREEGERLRLMVITAAALMLFVPLALVIPALDIPEPERAMSNIRQGFDSGKTALYSLYQRELRQDPTLAGKVLLELVIEPDGSVSACKVVSSELESPALEQKIAMRVRLFNFGADKVETRKVRFPIDFLPG